MPRCDWPFSRQKSFGIDAERTGGDASALGTLARASHASESRLDFRRSRTNPPRSRAHASAPRRPREPSPPSRRARAPH